MEEPRKEKRTWPIAVAVSLALHAAVLVGLELLPRSAIEEEPEGPCQVTMASGGKGGDLQLIHVVAPANDIGPRLGQRTNLEIWPNAPTQDPNAANVSINANSSEGGSAAKAIEQGVPETGAPGPAARGGTTTFFQVPAHGRRIVYVLDASMSMGKDGALKVAQEELLQSIRNLPSDVHFQVIVYNTQPRFLNPRWETMLRPTRDVKEEIADGLANLNAEGGTDHAPALKKALSLRPDVIYFLTDADDLKQEHLRLVNRLNQGHTVIHTIELSPHNRHRPGMPLQLLASENRGQYQAVDLRGR
ncbi:MAG: VWA domain-containing protein [Planctomycetes bacterium]|nr:VWA domain-containing protein [Planctomycetota bacterium]